MIYTQKDRAVAHSLLNDVFPDDSVATWPKRTAIYMPTPPAMIWLRDGYVTVDHEETSEAAKKKFDDMVAYMENSVAEGDPLEWETAKSELRRWAQRVIGSVGPSEEEMDTTDHSPEEKMD